jgi:hypothetical protein
VGPSERLSPSRQPLASLCERPFYRICTAKGHQLSFLMTLRTGRKVWPFGFVRVSQVQLGVYLITPYFFNNRSP